MVVDRYSIINQYEQEDRKIGNPYWTEKDFLN